MKNSLYSLKGPTYRKRGKMFIEEGLSLLQEYAYTERPEDLEEALKVLREGSSSFLPSVASEELSEILEDLEGHRASGTLETFVQEVIDRLDVIAKEL